MGRGWSLAKTPSQGGRYALLVRSQHMGARLGGQGVLQDTEGGELVQDRAVCYCSIPAGRGADQGQEGGGQAEEEPRGGGGRLELESSGNDWR